MTIQKWITSTNRLWANFKATFFYSIVSNKSLGGHNHLSFRKIFLRLHGDQIFKDIISMNLIQVWNFHLNRIILCLVHQQYCIHVWILHFWARIALVCAPSRTERGRKEEEEGGRRRIIFKFICRIGRIEGLGVLILSQCLAVA